jgi:hypothetical protein
MEHIVSVHDLFRVFVLEPGVAEEKSLEEKSLEEKSWAPFAIERHH